MSDELKNWLLKEHQKALLDGIEMGKTYATARIIKLVEDNFADTNLRQEIIALIKGETVQAPSVSTNRGQTEITDKEETE